MKKTGFILAFILLLVYSGCSGPDTGGGGTAPQTVPLSFSSFIGTCWKPNSVDPVSYTIDTYVETLDNNSGASSQYSEAHLNSNSSFPSMNIEVPSSGTYTVLVYITANDCSDCCINSGDCSGQIIYSGNTPVARKAGYPKWRGLRNFINQTSRPSSIFVQVNRVQCNCTCNVPW